MATALLLLACLAIFAYGFALQRGTICAVAAVEDLLERRDARRLIAFLLGAIWTLGLVVLLEAASGSRIETLPEAAVTWATLGGAALYGLGAALNGGCVLGSIARLAQGKLQFLALLPGFLLGMALFETVSALADGWRPALAAAGPVPTAARWAALAALAIPAYHLIRARGSVLPLRRRWSPAKALAVMAGASALLAFALGPWTYTAWLSDLAIHGTEAGRPEERDLALFGSFLGGAAVSALLGPDPLRFVLSARLFARSLLGGLAMGFAAGLIPGGNDLLLFFGLPFLLLHAWAAYPAMLGAIALALAALPRKGPLA